MGRTRGRGRDVVLGVLVAVLLGGRALWGMPPAPQSLIDLGARLFADRSLSVDGTIACASCHRPELAFADRRAVSPGARGAFGARNAPSLLGAATRTALTWDGRTKTIADQVLIAFTHPREQGLADAAELVVRVSANSEYQAAFSEAFGAPSITTEQIRSALTAYIAALKTGTSAYDRWLAGETAALSPSAQRGLATFTNAGGCTQCHRLDASPAAFTDDRYHDVGIGLGRIAANLGKLAVRVENTSVPQLEALIAADPDIAALGRYLVTRDPKDIGKYRTPSLRNVAVTAPYFHDGSVASLEEAVAQELYYRAQERGRALALNTLEQADLIAFMRALTDAPFERYVDPAASPAAPSEWADSTTSRASPIAAHRVAKGE